MKILLCVMDSLGLAMPMVGLARELASQGHDVACVSNPSMASACHAYGVRRIGTGSESASFTMREWISPPSALSQFHYLNLAAMAFTPDVVIASQFGYGPAMYAELAELPLVVLGGMTHTWAAGTYRRQEGVQMFDAARAMLGLRPIGRPGLVGNASWLGDLLLLQSSPRLSGPLPCSPHVRWVGDCSWEPPTASDPELAAWLGDVAHRRRRLVYVQYGREFGEAPLDDRLMGLATQFDLALAIDTGRSDRPRSHTDERMFVRPFVPRGQVLPACTLVVGAGHPSTVLGALAHRVPMVLVANGSGTEETALAIAGTGAAVVWLGTLSSLASHQLQELMAQAIGSSTMREAARVVASELAALGGRRRVAELVVSVARRNDVARDVQRELPA